MQNLIVVTGGLLAATLLVGTVLYLVLGQTLDIEWDSEVDGTEPVVDPDE